ncbi:hypothetical protein [Spirosoma areae]
MKTHALALIITLFALAGCKKEDVDPRDGYVGDYDTVSTSYTPAGSGSLGSVKASSHTSKEKITITKSSTPNVLIISSEQAARVYTATLKEDAVFVLDPFYSSETYVNNTRYTITVTGDGRFIGNSLKLSIAISAPALGMNQAINVVGTKR